VRSTSSIALHVLRVIEDTLIKSSSHNIIVHTRTPVALYILNQKRAHLRSIEDRFGVSITIAADDALTGTTYHAIERGESARGVVASVRTEPLRMDSVPLPIEDEPADEEADDGVEAEGGEDRRPDGRDAAGDDAEAQRRRRRRRRGRGRGDRDGQFLPADAPQPSDDGLAYVAASTVPELGQGEPAEPPAEGEQEAPPSERGDLGRSRRPRRGGRGRGDREGGFERGRRSGPPGEPREQFDRGPGYWAYSEGAPAIAEGEGIAPAPQSEPASPPAAAAPQTEHAEAQSSAELVNATDASIAGVQGAAEPERPEAPPPRRAPATPPEHVLANQKVITQADPDRPKRGGWWQRAKATLTGGE
jgi:ribonuclease E